MADGGGETDDRSIPGPIDSLAGEPADVARGAAERLVFFSDAVVAIAITLLAIELPVPEGDSTASLLDSLGADSIAYLTFLISFLVIGAHWRSHHQVFRYLRRVDGTFVHLNFGWLLVIIVTPFLTEVIREGDLNIARFGLYAPAQALLLIFFGLMQWVAARRGLFVPGSPPEVAGRGWLFQHQFLGILGFLGSIPLYPVLGAWAFALWALIPNLPQLVGAVWRRKPSSAAA